jgi:hypothetical protein
MSPLFASNECPERSADRTGTDLASALRLANPSLQAAEHLGRFAPRPLAAEARIVRPTRGPDAVAERLSDRRHAARD